VVWDNRQPVIVVARGDLAAWQALLAPLKTAVAPSCIDQTLLALVHQALPRMPNQGVWSGGYNAVDDAIFVSGVDADALLAELERLRPGAKAAARAAIADGTLRISSADGPGSRGTEGMRHPTCGIERPEAADASGLWLLALVPRVFVRAACREEC
jgi:hypothetical protein